LGNVLNTQIEESGASLSADGLSLSFHSNAASGGTELDIYLSTRASKLDPWSPAENLGSVINSVDHDLAPEIASDRLSLYFHSLRQKGSGATDIWRATRSDLNSAWNAPVALSLPVNTIRGEFGADLSKDAQTLYFGNDSNGSSDIWIAVP